MRPTTRALVALCAGALLLAGTGAAGAPAPPERAAHRARIDAALAALFRECLGARGGAAQRECEGRYYAFLRENYGAPGRPGGYLARAK